MTAEEALARLGIEMPWNRKLSCPKHSDTDPSLHIYEGDRGWYCYACAEGGGGWKLLSWYTGTPVATLLAEAGVDLSLPRPRSRWEQIETIQLEARRITWDFTLTLRGMDIVPWPPLAQYGDEVDYLFPLLFTKDVPEEVTPAALSILLDALRLYYENRLSEVEYLVTMSQESHDSRTP